MTFYIFQVSSINVLVYNEDTYTYVNIYVNIYIYDLRERREGRGRLWSLARKKGKGSQFLFWNSSGNITGALSPTLDHVDSIMSRKH